MKFDYDAASVAQGKQNQNMAEEQPNTFAVDSNASHVNQRTQLDKPKQRMAGMIGNRMLEYLNNPMEMSVLRMDGMFADCEGMQFNAAKMGIPPQDAMIRRAAGAALGLGKILFKGMGPTEIVAFCP